MNTRSWILERFRTGVIAIFCLFCALLSPLVPAASYADQAPTTGSSVDPQKVISDRASCLRAIGEVYWDARIWPAVNPGPKPDFSAIIPPEYFSDEARKTLAMGLALESIFGRAIEPVDLQNELDRIAAKSRRPDLLRRIFASLGNNPEALAECLARPLLTERWLRESFARAQEGTSISSGKSGAAPAPFVLAPSTLSFEDWWKGVEPSFSRAPELRWFPFSYRLPEIQGGTNCDNSWLPTSQVAAAERRYNHAAVWTGAEMIVWGGRYSSYLQTGGRYDPATYSWAPMSLTAAHVARDWSSDEGAVWTGTEVIIWGGGYYDGVFHYLDSGGRYSPTTDSWLPTHSAAAPSPRSGHSMVWTGTQVVVWGGFDGIRLNTGALYSPATDSWTPTGMTSVPSPRASHLAVFTGTEMIIWGGFDGTYLNTGGRFNPASNTWSATSIVAAPAARNLYTAVWTGKAMVVWGGTNNGGGNVFNTGGRYFPQSNSWLATSTISAPAPRYRHSAVWTGSEMIVWGGADSGSYFASGGRYDPDADSWIATSTSTAPGPRADHRAIYSGNEMIIWGGTNGDTSGGRYCVSSSVFRDGFESGNTSAWAP